MALAQPRLWSLAKEFMRDSGLVHQHIDSYNDFVERGLQAIVDEVGELPIDIGDYPLRIKLGKIEIGNPRVIEVDGTERSVYPAEARIRNLTYAAPLRMEMIPVIGEREGQPEMVYIGDLPVMLKSKICLLSRPTRPKSSAPPSASAHESNAHSKQTAQSGSQCPASPATFPS